jgi:hypothetical protein
LIDITMKKKDKLALIHSHYPGALTTIDCVNRIIDLVEDHLDLEPAQVMLADSICSDDVNSIQYPARTREFLGPFKMGGLDGFPFTGLTGMGAFASHVPDDGAVLVYYGPHIGISGSGTVGEIHRPGQKHHSGCCGAARAALAKLTQDTIQPGLMTELDHQMNTLEQILLREKQRILTAHIPLQEATQVIYEAIDRRIEELAAATTYKCRYLILLGAILINSDTDIGSFTANQKLDVIDLRTGVRSSHLAAVT